MSITVENLTKKYGTQRAVDDISFKVETGEVVGFLGPNGAGKSTTMKMITCFMAPTEGKVMLDEFSAAEDADEIKQRIGYLPENNPLYLDMPIIDYLQFCAEIQGVEKEEISPRLHEIIDSCGLNDEKHKKINELSKGYRILIINKGRIVADGTSETLRQQAQGQELLEIEIDPNNSEGDILKALTGLATVETVKPMEGSTNKFTVQSKPDESSRRSVFDLCVSKKWYLTEMRGIETKLEDVFRDLTMDGQ